MNRKMTAILAAHALTVSAAVAFAVELGMYLASRIRPTPWTWIGLTCAVLGSITLAVSHVWLLRQGRSDGDLVNSIGTPEEQYVSCE